MGTMRKFEYKKIWRGSDRLSLIELNMLGDEGWELVTTYSSGPGYDIIYIFKREKHETNN
jgi:hypothetical protein